MNAQIADVVVRHVSRECFTSRVHAAGYLVPRATAVIMFPTPGYRIVEVRAKVGDAVKRGDVLARAAPVAPALASAKDAAVSSDIALSAPATGSVLQSTAVVGMPTTQTPLFTLAVDGIIEASVEVPGVHVIELKPGQPARLIMGDGDVIEGRVRRPPPVVEAASQMGTARLSVEANGAIMPGRFVQATIEARRSCGIGVPMAALRHTSSGAYVQVLEGDRIASRAVTLGLANETDSEITAGLTEGDVVVAGAGSSQEGDRVKPVYSDGQDAP